MTYARSQIASPDNASVFSRNQRQSEQLVPEFCSIERVATGRASLRCCVCRLELVGAPF